MTKLFYKDLWGKIADKLKFMDSPIKSGNDILLLRWFSTFLRMNQNFWNYHIGSYQVLEKFLKDRKGRTLNLDEIQRYLKIIFSISSTLEIQKEIDKIITRED
jgi:hypothetical protein